MKSEFIFCLCNIGNEDLLKTEVAHFFPQWKFSYNRQGFITFKLDRAYEIHEVPHLFFSRRTGLCLGRELPNNLQLKIQDYFLYSPEQSTKNRADIGEVILNKIHLSEKETWYGIHLQNESELRESGAWAPVTPPEESPSRAYQKVAEAKKLFGLEFKKGQTAFELGSAPGGAVFFMLEQGLEVFGVDPAMMSEVCLKNQHFHHLRLTAQELKREHFPSKIDWLLSDLNLAPHLAAKQLLYVAKFFGSGLKGIIFTAKMTDKSYIQEMPELFTKLKESTNLKLSWAQLPSHGQEFLILLRSK